MYNIKLAGLDTGKKYYVKVRAKVNGYETSEWSLPFMFETPRDTMPPGRVENVSFVSEGDSFIAKWEAPRFNEDGSVCGDVSHYRLIFKDLDRNVVREERTVDTTYAMDFNKNIRIFGQPAGRIELTISAVDLAGNEGQTVVVIAQNPPPAKVQNVTAAVGVEAISLKWDANEENDLAHYELHTGSTAGFAVSSSTLRAKIAPGTNTHTHDTASLTMLYFKIVAVDKFNQKSEPSDVVSAQPRLTTDYDKEPPGAVAGFTVVQLLAADSASTIARMNFTARTEDDLDKYEVQYRKTGETALPWSFANIPSDQTSAEVKPLPLSTSYDFKIRAVDFNSNKGDWSPVVVAPGVKKLSPPPAPTNVTALGGMTNLMVTWTESSDPTMSNWAGVYEVHSAKTPTFSNPSVIKTSSTLASLINLDENTVYYVRVRSIDPFGNIGPWSNVESENTGEVESGGNKSTFEATDPTGTGHTDGDIWYKVDAEENIIGMWEFFYNNWIRREVKNLADDSVTSATIAADAVLAGHIKAGEIEGSHLKADTALINDLNIQSSLTINHASGHIKSSNYNANGSAGFYMDQQQLIINQGKISAAAIELQDSQNILPTSIATLSFSDKFYQGKLLNMAANFEISRGTGYRGSDAFVVTADNQGFAMVVFYDDLMLDIGEKYIVSAHVKGSSVPNSVFSILHGPDGEEQTVLDIGEDALSDGWKRVYITFEATTASVVLLLLVNNITEANKAFSWSRLQLERMIGADPHPSAWKVPGLTTISGDSIVTGAISSNEKITTANGSLAKWSINTEGNARFADATIDGKLIVGADVSNKEATSIQSDTYSAGIAGWAIKGNGDVEFNNGTFRGKLSLEKAGVTDIPLKMTASVSNVKLFINDSDHQDINVASIRGVTYAYDRAQIGGEGPYYPTNPVPSKIGRYYFGPTTDRSVNIQVHEGEEDAVYLETPPNDVALTSLFVGELTNPADEPVERERQGFGFSATRIETDPSTPSRKSSTGVSQSSSVQLRSPFYPESLHGEYPESTHLFESKVDFRSPLSKNLFFRSYALPDLTIGDGTTSRTNRPDYVSRAYDLTNEINKSTYVKVPVSGAGNPTGTKRHIFSAYIDTLDAFTDTAVYAFANNVPMNPIGDDKLSAGATQYQHADTLSTLAPDYRYQFNTAAASYSNSGSGSQVLTRTQGSVVTGPESSIFAFSNTSYTAPSTYNMNLGMTFSVWFQPSYVSGEQVFFHRGAASMREIWIRYNATNRTFTGGMVSAGTTTWSAPNNLIDPAKWNQVTFTFDSIGAGTKNMRIYVNGVLQFTQVIAGWTTAFSTEPLYLFSNLQATSFYLGGLSEPMVFHKVLTAAQVTSLYNRGTPIYRAGGLSTLSQNGILVESGNAAQRVAFEYTPSSTVATTITLQVVGASSNTVLAYKIQLERASYQENVNLPDRIRAKIAPTPWMTNGSNSLSTASLKLKAEPSPDIESWSISSLGDYQRMGPRGIEANKKKSPAELELSLSSSYSHPGGGSATSASATYKWGTTGMSYPGSKFPFMPAAASIIWDYNSLASASRPPIGGSGNLITTINLADSSFGAINTGAGKSLEDKFTASDGTQLGYPWIRVGTPDLPISANRIRIRKHASQTSGLPADFVYNAEPLIQTNQEVHIRVDNTVVTFGPTYRYNGALVINYDPNADSGIFARVRDGGTRLWEVYVMNNGLITYSTSGTFTTAINNWTDFKLRRENSNVRLTLGNVTLFNGTIGTLPTGKYVGFSMDAGVMDDFKAYDIAPGSTAMGMLLPESVNVNEGRGIFVNPNGVIAVDVPGYYMVTGCVRGAIGGDIARTYWLEIFETRTGGNTKTHPISGWQNRSSSDMNYVFGSGICYLEGTVEFRIATHTTNVSRISGADLHIVRMA